MAADPLTAIEAQIEDCIADPELEPEERAIKLGSLRERLMDLAGRADRYFGNVAKLREAEASEVARNRLWARGVADLRETLISEGEDPRDLDEAGFPTHVELDRLEEEGLLEEAAATMRKSWDQAKHPRGPAGRFAHTDFFHMDDGAFLAHRDRLRPTRTDTPEHIEKARRFAMQAARGTRNKRDPLDVRENGDGTLSIVDGNSTFAALKGQLEHFPVKVGGAESGEEAAAQRAADEIARNAASAEPSVTPAMKAVTRELGGSLSGLEHKLKSVESIRSKIERKQEKYPGMTADRAAQKIMDPVRYTAVFPDDQYVDGVKRVLSSLNTQGFATQETRNYWGDSDEYDGYHAIVQGPRDVKVEVQFHTAKSIAAAKANHGAYEQFRVSTDPGQRHALWQQMIAAGAKTPRPIGIEALGPTMMSPAAEARQRREET